MKVLVLNQHYWPETAATAQLLSDVCEDLVEAGHQVTVLTGQPSYREDNGPARSLAARETHSGVDVRRVMSYRPSRRGIPQRVAHYLSFFVASMGAALRERRPDVVLVLSTPPLLLGLSGALLQLARRVPFVYAVQDLYPDIAIDLGVLRPGPFTAAVEAVARRLYRSAAAIITLSTPMSAALARKGVDPDHIEVIPNWADTDAIRPLPRDNAFARAHGLTDRFVVQYSGNVGLSQGIEHLPAAAERVSEDVLFLVVGGGNAREGLEAAVRLRGLGNVKFLPPQPRDRLAELLASCDVGWVPMRRGVGADLVPSKLYGILAAGRPVVASVDDQTEVAQVVRAERCGVALPAEDPAALAAGLTRLQEDGAALRGMGRRGRRACEARFSRRGCTARYEQVLRRVAG